MVVATTAMLTAGCSSSSKRRATRRRPRPSDHARTQGGAARRRLPLHSADRGRGLPHPRRAGRSHRRIEGHVLAAGRRVEGERPVARGRRGRLAFRRARVTRACPTRASTRPRRCGRSTTSCCTTSGAWVARSRRSSARSARRRSSRTLPSRIRSTRKSRATTPRWPVQGDALEKAGVDLDLFNTPISAADLRDLRTTLGYKQWDLLGVSYGARIALEMLRADPEGTRAAIIDSAYIPGKGGRVDSDRVGARTPAPGSSPRAQRPGVRSRSIPISTRRSRTCSPRPTRTRSRPRVTLDDGTKVPLALTGSDISGALFNAQYDESLDPAASRPSSAACSPATRRSCPRSADARSRS